MCVVNECRPCQEEEDVTPTNEQINLICYNLADLFYNGIRIQVKLCSVIQVREQKQTCVDLRDEKLMMHYRFAQFR